MASQPTLKSCLKKRSKSVYEPMLTVSFNKSPSARNVRFEPMVYQHSYSETRVNDDKNTRPKITPKKRNREVELLIEAQMNWKPIDTYYIDDQPKVVTRSARKRRFTIDTFHSHEESPPSSKTSRSSQKQKPKPAPQKKPGAKKSRAKQPRNNLENAFAQLRDGVNKMSKASRNYTKTEFYDISSFPECALFLKVNDETTFCKMAFNTGIAYMDVGAVRAWTFHDAGVIANYFVIKGKLTVDIEAGGETEVLEVGPFSFLKLKPFARFRLRNMTEQETIFILVGCHHLMPRSQ